MAYHDDLLRLASELTDKDAPNQADLRRAASTAYYSVFHLLVSEASLNWTRDSSRNTFGRMFDHGLMKRVSSRVADLKTMPYAGEDPGVVSKLRLVAGAFVQLQNQRHVADYDNGTLWTQSGAFDAFLAAASAFFFWGQIRHTDIAQEYLVSLLIRPRD